VDELPAQTYFSHLSANLELHPAAEDPAEVKLSENPATVAKIGPDPERGQVLKLAETSAFRDGGLVLPARSDGKPIATIEATPTLSFDVKSVSKDPLAIRLDSSDGKTVWVSIGQDPILVTPRPNTVVASSDFSSDGKWQRIAVDLRPLAKQAGMVDVLRMAIEPTPNAKLAGKLQPEPIDYSFADFKFSTDPAGSLVAPVSPSASSADPEARALFAAQAKSAGPELAALLKDKSPMVRLNATTAYIGIKDPTVEEALISNSLDLDPSVAAAAMNALNAEGSDTAKAVVRRSVSVSLSDYAKMAAAKLLADTKNPKVVEDVSRLLAARSWQAHVWAVESLAEIETPESQTYRLAFIGMSDPAVKLAVTEHADPAQERVASALLWSAVNEPSDVVRAASYIKLIQSTSVSNKTEGYKGVRDDSRFVRKLVLRYLAAFPSEEHRGALRIAVADRSAQVRAEALLGFAALEKGATSDEIANVLDDPDPTVELALIELSKKRSLKLPQKTLDAMLASPDPRVSTAAKALG
jgi:HEAT repeat protein